MLPVFCRLALARSTSTLTLAVYLPFSTFSISFLADLVSASTSTVGLAESLLDILRPPCGTSSSVSRSAFGDAVSDFSGRRKNVDVRAGDAGHGLPHSSGSSSTVP